MHTLVVLYGQPVDPSAFDDYYTNTHTPLALGLPGARATRASLNLNAPEGQSPYYAIFEADFDTSEDMAKALESPQGQLAQADTRNFATGGLTLLDYSH
jgi:uncharacterized protein (TIGR02118 family)